VTVALSKGRLAALAAVALLPAAWKPAVYRRVFGYTIGRRVRIGLSILDCRHCEIGDGVVIGHGNIVVLVDRLVLGDRVNIGHLNIIRGGDEVRLDRDVSILRLNEINSIPNPEVVNPIDPRLHVGAGTVIAAGHKIDFTDRVEIGRDSVVAGRHSSLWTHSRQRTAPIVVGEQVYLGSEIRIAPGATVPPRSMVGLGSVIVGDLGAPDQFFAGVPARPVRPLTEDDRFLVRRRTEGDPA